MASWAAARCSTLPQHPGPGPRGRLWGPRWSVFRVHLAGPCHPGNWFVDKVSIQAKQVAPMCMWALPGRLSPKEPGSLLTPGLRATAHRPSGNPSTSPPVSPGQDWAPCTPCGSRFFGGHWRYGASPRGPTPHPRPWGFQASATGMREVEGLVTRL